MDTPNGRRTYLLNGHFVAASVDRVVDQPSVVELAPVDEGRVRVGADVLGRRVAEPCRRFCGWYAAQIAGRPGTKPQATPAEVLAMSDDELAVAHGEGRLRDVVAGREAADAAERAHPLVAAERRGGAEMGARGVINDGGQLGRDDLQRMTPDAIVQARREGRLDDLMSGERRS
jgi:hypothetical protein